MPSTPVARFVIPAIVVATVVAGVVLLYSGLQSEDAATGRTNKPVFETHPSPKVISGRHSVLSTDHSDWTDNTDNNAHRWEHQHSHNHINGGEEIHIGKSEKVLRLVADPRSQPVEAFIERGLSYVNLLRVFCEPQSLVPLTRGDVRKVVDAHQDECNHIVDARVDTFRGEFVLEARSNGETFVILNERDGQELHACAVDFGREDSSTQVMNPNHNFRVMDAAQAVLDKTNELCVTSDILPCNDFHLHAAEEQVVYGIQYALRMEVCGAYYDGIHVVFQAGDSDSFFFPEADEVLIESSCRAFQDEAVRVLEQQSLAKVSKHNSGRYGFQQASYSQFQDLRHLRTTTGSFRGNQQVRILQEHRAGVDYTPSKSFDWRLEKPDCVNSGRVRYQGTCGSSWAMAPTTAVANMKCIEEDSPFGDLDHYCNQYYGDDWDEDSRIKYTCAGAAAPQFHIDCNEQGNGCSGGSPLAAFAFMEERGAMTESMYHYSGEQGQCRRQSGGDKLKCGSTKRAVDEVDIMHAIETKGPVTASLVVKSDFLAFTTGVYYDTIGNVEHGGAHTVQLIGWGTAAGAGPNGEDMDYWIGENSWGRWWGEGISEEGHYHTCYGGDPHSHSRHAKEQDCGYFRIQRGNNLLGIEEEVLTTEIGGQGCSNSVSSASVEWAYLHDSNMQGECKYVYHFTTDLPGKAKVVFHNLEHRSWVYEFDSSEVTTDHHVLTTPRPGQYLVEFFPADEDNGVSGTSYSFNQNIICDGGIEDDDESRYEDHKKEEDENVRFTESGCTCLEEWAYRDHTYKWCTRDGHRDGKEWCQVANPAVCGKSWDNCVHKDPPRRTVNGCVCKQYWQYNGDAYEGCTTVDHSTEWCEVSNPEDCGSRWDECLVTLDEMLAPELCQLSVENNPGWPRIRNLYSCPHSISFHLICEDVDGGNEQSFHIDLKPGYFVDLGDSKDAFKRREQVCHIDY